MRKSTIPVVLALLVVIGLGVRTSAQSPGIPSDAIQTTLNALATSVNAIRAAVTPGRVLASSALFAAPAGHAFNCHAVNVSSADRSITIELIEPGTNTLVLTY